MKVPVAVIVETGGGDVCSGGENGPGADGNR